jgi:hypothetical protein
MAKLFCVNCEFEICLVDDTMMHKESGVLWCYPISDQAFSLVATAYTKAAEIEWATYLADYEVSKGKEHEESKAESVTRGYCD